MPTGVSSIGGCGADPPAMVEAIAWPAVLVAGHYYYYRHYNFHFYNAVSSIVRAWCLRSRLARTPRARAPPAYHAMVCHGMASHSMACHGMTSHSMACHGMVCKGLAGHGMAGDSVRPRSPAAVIAVCLCLPV